jgi:hypothetical protein
MAFSFEETPASRSESIDSSGGVSYTLVYKACGEFNDALVMNYATTLSPVSVVTSSGVLYRKSISKDPDGWCQYVVTITYGKLDKKSVPKGSSTFSFDTSGATINIKAAKAHVASYESSGVVAGNFHGGAINVEAPGDVKGVDVIIPALKLTYTFNHPAGVVTPAFARAIASVTGMTNSGGFQGFDAGELLFAGASGSDGTEADAAVSYTLIASGNATNLSIGAISNIAKLGHDYLWVEFDDTVEDDEAASPPKRVHVERVYDSFDFASVFGWS